MANHLFHSTQKGRSDEDWFFVEISESDQSILILHKWSHGSGREVQFVEGEKRLTIDGFKTENPREFAILLKWLAQHLPDVH